MDHVDPSKIITSLYSFQFSVVFPSPTAASEALFLLAKKTSLRSILIGCKLTSGLLNCFWLFNTVADLDTSSPPA